MHHRRHAPPLPDSGRTLADRPTPRAWRCHHPYKVHPAQGYGAITPPIALPKIQKKTPGNIISNLHTLSLTQYRTPCTPPIPALPGTMKVNTPSALDAGDGWQNRAQQALQNSLAGATTSGIRAAHSAQHAHTGALTSQYPTRPHIGTQALRCARRLAATARAAHRRPKNPVQ